MLGSSGAVNVNVWSWSQFAAVNVVWSGDHGDRAGAARDGDPDVRGRLVGEVDVDVDRPGLVDRQRAAGADIGDDLHLVGIDDGGGQRDRIDAVGGQLDAGDAVGGVDVDQTGHRDVLRLGEARRLEAQLGQR